MNLKVICTQKKQITSLCLSVYHIGELFHAGYEIHLILRGRLIDSIIFAFKQLIISH